MIQWIKSLFRNEYREFEEKANKESEERRKEIHNFFTKGFSMPSPKMLYAEFDNSTNILTLYYEGDTKYQFKISETGLSWKEYPMMNSIPFSSEEQRLSDIYDYIKEHGNPYPTAHLNKKS
jgi:hypothetical protein